MALEGLPRHASTHAAGVVITSEPIVNYGLSDRVARKIGMKSPNVYFRANNLLTLAPEKERLLLNIGAEPAYTWFALGFKANF